MSQTNESGGGAGGGGGGVSTRKRKLTNENKLADVEVQAADKRDDVQVSRKSPRLSANRAKEPIKVETAPPQTPTRTRAKYSKSQSDDSKLNGAQFVTAAAAGNVNLTNSMQEESEKSRGKGKKVELEKIQPDKLKKSEEIKKQKLEQDQKIESSVVVETETSTEIISEKVHIVDEDQVEHRVEQTDEHVDKRCDDQIIILESETNSETKCDDQQVDHLIDKHREIIVVQEPLPTTQTIKLVDTPIEETHLKQTDNGMHNSDLNSSSDSSSSEDEDSSSGNTKKSSNGHKSGNIAILNKTKIDTEFISKLIGNKFPGDKRYDPNEINKLRLLSHSYQNFAVKLLVRLFDEEEIIGRNVYGRNYSGDKSITKQPLDPERINFIKETVLRLTKTNNPELAWASCVIAMNRKMVDINNKYFKNLKNKKVEDEDN